MRTTITATFKLLGVTLLAISITLLFISGLQIAQTLMTSVGWHGLATVSWNG